MIAPRRIPKTTVRRLSHYLRTLELLEDQGEATVSSEELAHDGGTTAAQVRKDLSHFGSFGKRGMGYSVRELLGHLRQILGVDRRWRVALVGAGRIGAALTEYPNFTRRGFDFVAVFDVDPAKVGTAMGSDVVRPLEEFESVIHDQCVDIVVLAVPADAAQQVADRAVVAGVRGILNFAPKQLRVPKGVFLKDVSLAMELESLSFDISRGDTDA
ncbi:MAG: redox-sensing transcriptional repressor Rex [Gemmatimonadota bacterium]|nr:redox-sensing transcriptional repressor Rex [Gemmatimonadota bacterium]